MSEIILSSGAYHKYVSGSSIAKTILKHGGYSLTTAVLDILAANTCCTKNIVADSVTTDSLTLTGGKFIGIYLPLFPQNITAGTGGAISVQCYSTTINTDAGGDAFTLADGTIHGQLKHIKLIVDGGGNATITVASFTAGTTITMNDAGDEVLLWWDTSNEGWSLLQNSGCIIA
jgi:hypothetical protein